MLKSRDATTFKEWDLGQSYFLDGEKGLEFHKTAFLSFPRAGNSFLRRLIENCTGIVTGASVGLNSGTGVQI
jgi:hypothetical protein